MALPTPAPYPVTGGAPRTWSCEGTTTTTNTSNALGAQTGSTATRSDSCVVTSWGSDPAAPAPLASVAVNNFPAAPVYPAPLATVTVVAPVGTPLPVHEKSPAPVVLTGTTVNAVAECGTVSTAACQVKDAGATTPAMVGGISLLLLLTAAALVATLKPR